MYDTNDIGEALREMLDITKRYEAEKEHEIIKVFNQKYAGEGYRIDLMVVKWKKTNIVSLECRKMFYKPRIDYWQMGGKSALSIDEVNAIGNNLAEIKQLLTS